MLGLLLIVTMLANYLSTELPGEMAVNEGDHALQVENQLLRLGAVLRSASTIGAIGAQLSQPISLGSQGEPPFAPASGGSIGPGVPGSSLYASFTVNGPVSYTGPGDWPAGGNVKGTGCTLNPAGSENPRQVTCSGGVSLTQNFTNGSHFISAPGGGTLHINFTTNYSTVSFNSSAGATLTSIIYGSHDNVYFNASSGGTYRVEVVGNHDNITLPSSSGMTLYVYIVGNHNHLVVTAPSGITMYLNVWGSYNTLSETTTGAAATIYAYFTGFDPVNVTTSNCPYDNDSATDKAYANASDGGTFDLNYNNTAYSGSGHVTGGSVSWTTTWKKVTGLTCPFYTPSTLTQTTSGALGASFGVHLLNVYSPTVYLAYDQGAIVYSQPNSQPSFLVDPNVDYANTILSVWMPEFLANVGTEVGVGAAALSLRLVGVLNLSLPSDNYALVGSTTLTVVSPYAEAWWGFFNATFPSGSPTGTWR